MCNRFRILLPLVMVTLMGVVSAWGQLLVEDFSYTSGTGLNGQGGWTAHSGGGTNPQLITTGGLTYSGYASSGIGNAVSFTTSGEDNNRPYATFPDGTVSGSLYYGLMVKIDSAGTTGDYFFHLAKNATTFSARLFVRRAANGNLRFGVGKSSTIGNINFSDSIYTPGTTYLLAAKYTVIAGTTNDTVALWINPTPGSPEPAPTVLQSAADRATTDIDTLYLVAVRQGTAANASIGVLDGIRVGTTWESVVAGGGTVKTINNTLPTGGDNYQSFTDAITALNAGPVPAGGILFNVSSGQTFTENPPEITATGTSADQITFRKSGAGANPKIVPAIAGTVASSTTIGSHGDGILIINGGDYITFDGIDLQTDPTFTGVGMMEYGYYLKKASGDNACKNITIKNCTITLNKAAIYSFGIFVSNISGTAAVTVTSTGGRSENIRMYSNTITNAYGGVQLRGFNHTVAPYDFFDNAIEVGAPANGNTINDFGGGASAAYAVYGIYQDSVSIRSNDISGGGASTSTVYGVFFGAATNAAILIDGNTIALDNSGTTTTVACISLQTGTTTGTTNAHNVTNNTLSVNRTNTTTGATYFVYCTTNYPQVLNVIGNTMGNTTTPGTGAMYGVYQISNPVSMNIRNNTISNIATNSSSLYAIYLSSTTTTQNTEISGNTIHSLTTGGSAGGVTGIHTQTAIRYRIFKNNIHNLSSTGATGTAIGITKLGTADTTYIYNNFISDLRAASSTSNNAVIGINVTATATTNYFGIHYNTIYLNASSSSATTFGSSGMFLNTGPIMDLRNNVVVNVSEPGPTGGGTVAHRRSSATLTSYANESNNNDFYVNPAAGVRRYFYGEGTTASVANADSTLAAYKTRVAPRDSSSIAENPPFINVATTPYNLHINSAAPTQLDGRATPIVWITDDFDGDLRNATTPDIGADEFQSTPLPPPVVSTIARSTRVPLAGDTVVVTCTITDTLGINTANLIYNINGTANSVAMTRTSGTPQNGAYRGVVPGSANQNGNRIELQIQANSTSGNSTTTPIAAARSYYAGISPMSLTGLRRTYPNGRIMDSLYYARVTGTVNGPNFQTVNLGYHFQDAVGGVQLFGFGITIPPLNLGDSITVLGRIAQFRGLTEIIPDTQATDIQVVATGRTVTPVTLTVPQFAANPEAYESRLVRINNLQRRDATPPWPTVGTSANIVMYQNVVTDTIIMRIDSDTQIPGSPEPTYPINVTGVMTQFTSAVNVYNDGYQTQPRYLTDLEPVVGVGEQEGLPLAYALDQNYPNPFNPHTQITYALPKESFVTLQVYNILGQRVTTLVSEGQKAGYATVTWDGTSENGYSVSSGVYFYRIEARSADGGETFTSLKKMMLLK